MMFVQLADHWIAVSNVTHIKPSRSGNTEIHMVGGAFVVVTEPPELVVKQLSGGPKRKAAA